jgi:hypothetical protein
MTTLTASAAFAAPPREREHFYQALAAATLVPLLLMPILARFHPASGGITGIRNLLIFLGGTGHVALTAFFYTDRELYALFKSHKARYVVVPILLILGTAIAYATLGAFASAHVLLAYFAWQTYHYMRQNYGIVAFVGLSTGSGPPRFLERVILNVGVFAGILWMVRLMALQVNTVFDGYDGLLYETGLLAYFFIPPLLVAAWMRSPELRESPTRAAFVFLFALFYLPTFLFDDLGSAISSYAFAHGLQYFVFMYHVGRGGDPPRPGRRLLLLGVCCLVFGSLLLAMSHQELWGRVGKLVFGGYLGFVMTHFVVDAGIWRMREPLQRRYLSRRFAFLLNP